MQKAHGHLASRFEPVAASIREEDLIPFSDVLRRDHGHMAAIRSGRVEPHVGGALGRGHVGLNGSLV